jgi:hypothetical protein
MACTSWMQHHVLHHHRTSEPGSCTDSELFQPVTVEGLLELSELSRATAVTLVANQECNDVDIHW